jgi:hypothetical protein
MRTMYLYFEVRLLRLDERLVLLPASVAVSDRVREVVQLRHDYIRYLFQLTITKSPFSNRGAASKPVRRIN